MKRVAVENGAQRDERCLAEVWESWEQDGRTFWQQMDALGDTLVGLVGEEVSRG